MPDTGDNLSPVWTPAQWLHWRETYAPVLASVALAFCIVAQIIFFKFPRLRAFPRSLLSWLNYYNMYFSTYIILKWIRGTPWHEAFTAQVKPGSLACRLGIFFDNSTLAGEYSCTTLLCFTIFLVVVCKVDIERYKTELFWGYLVFVLLYPFGIGVLASSGWATSFQQEVSCVLSDKVVSFVIRAPCFLFLLLQFIFLGSSIICIKKVLGSVGNNTISNFPTKYLFVRFAATFLVQLYNIVPSQTVMMFPYTGTNAIFMRFIVITHNTGTILDTLVLTIGNADFVYWLQQKTTNFRQKFGIFFKGSQSTNTPIKEQIQRETCISIVVDMEMQSPVSPEWIASSSAFTSCDSPTKISLEEEESDIPENLLSE